MLRVAAYLMAGLFVSCALAWAQAEDAGQHFARAIQLHQAGEIQGAIAEYEACLKIEPDRIDAISNLGAALARLGRHAEAIQQYQHALKVSPGDARIRMNLALA